MAGKNPFLRQANIIQEWTPEHLQELDKCADDPIYFIKKYCMVQHAVKGAIPFELYDYQEELIRAYQHNRMTIALLARQSGKCVTGETIITVCEAPTNWFKKLILRIVNPTVYRQIFQ